MNRDIRLSIGLKYEPHNFQESENNYHGYWEYSGCVVDKNDNQISCTMVGYISEGLVSPHLIDSGKFRIPTGQEQFEFMKRVEKIIEGLEQMPNYLTGGLNYD